MMIRNEPKRTISTNGRLGRFHNLQNLCIIFQLNPILVEELSYLIHYQIDLLKNKLGFHEVFNYKEEPDFEDTLRRYVFLL